MPSPRLARVSIEQLPQNMRDAHKDSMQLRGDATFFEVFANHPDLYRWYTDSFYAEVFRGGLVDRRSKELARLRLSTTHGCRFCNQGNQRDALLAGLAQSDIDHISDTSLDHFDGKDQAILRLADEIALTRKNGQMSAPIYEALRDYFDDAQILELGLVMGILSGVAKFLFAFDLVEKELNCPLHPGTI